jgi:hypothetical protein
MAGTDDRPLVPLTAIVEFFANSRLSDDYYAVMKKRSRVQPNADMLRGCWRQFSSCIPKVAVAAVAAAAADPAAVVYRQQH